MNEALDKFHSEFEKKALFLLRNSATFPSLESFNENDTVFRVWQYPSFEPYCSWTLRKTGEEFYVRRIEWNRNTDWEMPKGVSPTVYGSETLVPTSEAIGIHRKLTEIYINPFVESDSSGLDGVIYGIETASFWLNGSVSW